MIVAAPNYQSIESIPLASGVEVSRLPLWSGAGADLRWTLDLDRFQSLLRPNTALVSVNFPTTRRVSSPTTTRGGRSTSCATSVVFRVMSDEVYRGVEMDLADTLPAAVEINPSALSINVISKAYGLPGLRVGWIASHDRAALIRLERAEALTSICNAGPSEHLTALALRNGPAIAGRNRQIIAANDRLVTDVLGGHPATVRLPLTARRMRGLPRYLGDDGVESFCRRAVEEHGVLLLPSSVYHSAVADVPTDRFRIGIGRTERA